MKTNRKRMMLVTMILLSLGLAGCSLEEGFRDGVVDGASAALSAIIQAPVSQLLSTWFPDA